jgi:exopolyphosphatase / guanosine-5'-triphosphate,3'-diphosphate pyrophosphatase
VDAQRRTAVVDLGSNSFRLVVFTWTDAWWKRTDEIYEPVRIGEGLEQTGALQPEPMERALETIELFAQFCRATGITDVRSVATSAIREASNREAFLEMAARRTWLPIDVASQEQEARYGYLAAVNSTAIEHGVTLDIGGGSMQLVRVEDRLATDMRSWELGAVRMTERYLANGKTKSKRLRALRAHVREELAQAPWLAGAGRRGRLVGVGGAVRNLAAAAMLAAGLPSYGIQGFSLTRDALGELCERLAALPVEERGRVPGIKPERGDVILAGALVVHGVMEAGGFTELEATEAGLREGVFFGTVLQDSDPPLFADVRSQSVRNLAAQYGADDAHVAHVARLALEMWDELAAAGAHTGDPSERELLSAAALLHDIGTTVDYDDHHKHSRYLILNAGLPGFSPRETALIAQMARYHRKGTPQAGEFGVLMRAGDDELLDRCSAMLRLAEQLERARDQTVRHARVDVRDGGVTLRVEAEGDTTVARWAAQKQSAVFERAFGRPLEVTA